MTRLQRLPFFFLIGLFIGSALLLGYQLFFRLVAPTRLPTFFGYAGSFVVSGSMEPTVSTGDMVIFQEQDAYEIDDIIVYYDEEDGAFILHRIIGIDADGFITKGDFNPLEDPDSVQPECIQGKVVISLPNMKTYRDMLLGALLLLALEFIIKRIAHAHRAHAKNREEKTDETP